MRTSQGRPRCRSVTGDEAPLDDYQRDTSERYVFDEREIPPRIEQPSIKQVQATVEQQTAQDELRYGNSTLITVTNISAMMPPARGGSAGHGNRLSSSKFQGSVSATAASGLNSQPAA